MGFDGLYTEILMGYNYEKKDMTIDHFERMGRHKLKLLKEHDIKIYYDDNPFYTNLMKDHGVLTLMLCVDHEYMEKFGKADPFFTCHLQEKMFDFLLQLENKEVQK